MSARKATIRDVARRAAVSSATVSRYLNGSLQLPPDTAGRVDRAIAELAYAPNVLARALSTGRSGTLGIIVPDIANPFFAVMASAAEREAFAQGYALVLCSSESHPARERHYLAELRAQRIDGTLFVSEYTVGHELADQLAGFGNLVLVDEGIEGFGGAQVLAHNRRGGRLATEHLLALGHRRIGLIAGPAHLMTSRERRAGYEDALRAHGLWPDPRLTVFGSYREATGREALPALLDLDDPPTAVFASSDVAALGVLRAARARGLRVPEDLSLVGFDDIPVAELVSPAITTVAQPIERLGVEGIRTLVRLLRGDGDTAREQRMDVALVVRESTAARSP